jgi:regulator of protease activity HflC (stomatin/prohibitin superfamily)
MVKRLDTETVLQKEHLRRQVQRSTTFILSIVLAAIVEAVGIVAGILVFRETPWLTPWVIGAGSFGAVAIVLSMRVALQWDKAVVLRMGHFRGLKGPGVFWLVPIVDRIARYVDMRIRATEFFSERTLTKDTVPVNVDAIIFWRVDNAERAALAITNYRQAIERVAQSTLRETIGASMLASLLSDRQAADAHLRDVIAAKTVDWGIAVISVEIRDVAIPEALQDAMSRQAQAEREKQARVILGSAEAEIAAKFVEAATIYGDHPAALQLRAMNIIYETTKERGATILIPSSMIDALNPGKRG